MTDTGTTTYPINTADTDYYKTTSAGAGDEGKIPLLDSAGKLDSSMDSGMTTNTSNETLGEDLNTDKAYVKPTTTVEENATSTLSGTSTSYDLEVNSTTAWAANIVGLSSDVKGITGIMIPVTVVAASGNIIIELWEGANNTMETNTLLGSKSFAISSTGNKVIKFDTPISIDGSKAHTFVWKTTDTLNIDIDIKRYGDPAGTGDRYETSNNQGTTWSDITYEQDSYTYYITEAIAGLVYGAEDSAIDGFTQETGDKGDEISCIQNGIATISGLTTKGRHKLTGTGGSIIEGADGIGVGISSKDGEILIVRNI